MSTKLSQTVTIMNNPNAVSIIPGQEYSIAIIPNRLLQSNPKPTNPMTTISHQLYNPQPIYNFGISTVPVTQQPLAAFSYQPKGLDQYSDEAFQVPWNESVKEEYKSYISEEKSQISRQSRSRSPRRDRSRSPRRSRPQSPRRDRSRSPRRSRPQSPRRNNSNENNSQSLRRSRSRSRQRKYIPKISLSHEYIEKITTIKLNSGNDWIQHFYHYENDILKLFEGKKEIVTFTIHDRNNNSHKYELNKYNVMDFAKLGHDKKQICHKCYTCENIGLERKTPICYKCLYGFFGKDCPKKYPGCKGKILLNRITYSTIDRCQNCR